MAQEFRHILRIIDADVDGTLKASYAVAKIKGVSLSLATALLRKAEIDPEKRAGFLNETELERVEEMVRDPSKFGMPVWMLNRRKDEETGKDMHLISSELVLRGKMDVEHLKDIKSWRGYRHAYGLKARGQRTKTTGRAGKALGVKKKELMKRPVAEAKE